MALYKGGKNSKENSTTDNFLLLVLLKAQNNKDQPKTYYRIQL